ncbi:MAG: DHH family phosphoesterase [Promethearchaeota archaeon]
MTETPNYNRFMEDFKSAVDNFMDHSFDKYIAVSHNDADGISSLHLIQNMLHRLGKEHDYFIYNRSISWANYLNGIFNKSQSEKIAFIFTDVGSNLAELIPIIKNHKEHFFILDHHEVDGLNVNSIELPENLHFVNPTIHGYDGLDHIAGATLAYMFAREIKPAIIKQGWLTIIGIAGDTLRSMDKLESFNKDIYNEILEEEIFENREGPILFGSMHDSIKNALKHSILPFVKGLGSEDDQKIKLFLKKVKIESTKKVVDLDPDEVQRLQESTPEIQRGNYAILPKKTGILSFAFEHALLLNILCFKNISAAVSIIQRKAITHYAIQLYYEYITNLVKNLKTFFKLPRYETEYAIFIKAKGRIPPSNWSDTASFVTVNEILNPHKILFLGGEETKNHMYKLSIRCTRKYLKDNNGNGVNKVIRKIKDELGGMGGGHKLAGGIRLSIPSFKRLKANIDDYCEFPK